MGCDIHLYLEQKQTVRSVSTWVNVDNYRPDPYNPGEFIHVDCYDSRNYDLFAILADVRNRQEVEPIAQPRGVPDDMSKEVRGEYERWEGDGHSHSHFTLKELIDARDSGKYSRTYSGLIGLEQREALDRGEFPTSWCQGTNMPGFERRTWTEPGSHLDDLVEKLTARYREEFCRWGDLDLKDAEKFRIVFWFDN